MDGFNTQISVNITRNRENKSMKYSILTNFIKGESSPSNGKFLDVFSPLNGEVITQVPLSSADVVDDAVAGAKQAFPNWANLSLKDRAQIFFRYRHLLEKHFEELAALITE